MKIYAVNLLYDKKILRQLIARETLIIQTLFKKNDLKSIIWESYKIGAFYS